MRKLAVVLVVPLLLVTLGAGPADAWGRGGYRGGYYRAAGCYGCGWAGFAVGLGVGTLLTAPLWYPRVYTYPAYVPAYPAYPAPYVYPPYVYPGYGYPASTYPAYTPPATGYTYSQIGPGVPAAPPAPSAAPPTPPAAPDESQAGPEPVPGPCRPVTVEGHYETRVLPGGQRETTWVPAYRAEICP
jgi:hypothetical protein